MYRESNMKRWQYLLFTSFMVFCSLSWASEPKIVNVYNWANAISPSVLRQFEKETGIKVNYSTYNSNEVLYAKLAANPNAGYDVIFPSTYFIERMRKHGMLQKLDRTKLPHFKNLDPALLNKSHDPNNEYSIPYVYSFTGIAYNDQYYKQVNRFTWNEFWKPDYKNQLLLLDDTRDVFSMALLSLGYSANDKDPQHIREAFDKLKLLIPNVKLFNTDAQKTLFIEEDVTLGIAWSSHMYLAHKENPHVQITYPKEGFVISMESMVVPKNAPHVNNAHIFIDFLLRAENAKDVTETTGFSTANLAAMALLPPEVRNNPMIYPPKNIFKRGQLQTDTGTNATVLYERYFQELKLQ